MVLQIGWGSENGTDYWVPSVCCAVAGYLSLSLSLYKYLSFEDLLVHRSCVTAGALRGARTASSGSSAFCQSISSFYSCQPIELPVVSPTTTSASRPSPATGACPSCLMIRCRLSTLVSLRSSKTPASGFSSECDDFVLLRINVYVHNDMVSLEREESTEEMQ